MGCALPPYTRNQAHHLGPVLAQPEYASALRGPGDGDRISWCGLMATLADLACTAQPCARTGGAPQQCHGAMVTTDLIVFVDPRASAYEILARLFAGLLTLAGILLRVMFALFLQVSQDPRLFLGAYYAFMDVLSQVVLVAVGGLARSAWALFVLYVANWINGVLFLVPGGWASYVVLLITSTVAILRLGLWLGRFIDRWIGTLWNYVFSWTPFGRAVEYVAAWALRGSLAPPAVLPAEDESRDSFTSYLGATREGKLWSQAAGLTHVSVSAGGLTPSRVRARASWVNRMREELGSRGGSIGELVKGRWTPDLPSSKQSSVVNTVLALLAHEQKVLGGGLLPTTAVPRSTVIFPDRNDFLDQREYLEARRAYHSSLAEETTGSEGLAYLVVETQERRMVVVPSLLGRLSQFAMFRDRDSELLLSLKSRARDWVRENGVEPMVAALVLPDNIMAAYRHSAPELLALGDLAAIGESTLLTHTE